MLILICNQKNIKNTINTSDVFNIRVSVLQSLLESKLSDSLCTTYSLIIDAPAIDGKNTKNTQEESIPLRKQIRKHAENVKELPMKASL